MSNTEILGIGQNDASEIVIKMAAKTPIIHHNPFTIILVMNFAKAQLNALIFGVLSGISTCYFAKAEETDIVADTRLTVEMPSDIKNVLEKNAPSLNSVSFLWVTNRSTEMDLKTFFVDTKMEHNCGFFEPESNVFMWQNGCGYFFRAARTSVEFKDGKMPFAYEKDIILNMYSSHYAYDGQVFYAGAAPDNNPGVMSIYPKTNENSFLPHPYTFCAGYKYPNSKDEFEIPPTSYVLYLAQKGGLKRVEETVLENHNAVEIELVSKGWNAVDGMPVERIMSFWLLPEYNYTVKQIDIKSLDNKIAHRIINDDFRKISAKNVYVPYRSTIQHYTYSTIKDTIFSSPLFVEELVLSEFTTQKINKDQFNLRKKFSAPGTLVGDRTLRDTEYGVQYTIPANPADLDRVIEAALTGGTFVPTPLPSTFAIIFRWFLCVAGIAMTVYAGYRAFIRKI